MIHRVVGAEGTGLVPLDEAQVIGDVHGGGIPVLRRHVGEGGAALALPAPVAHGLDHHGHQLRPGELALGGKVPGLVAQEDPQGGQGVDLIAIERIGHIVEPAGDVIHTPGLRDLCRGDRLAVQGHGGVGGDGGEELGEGGGIGLAHRLLPVDIPGLAGQLEDQHVLRRLLLGGAAQEPGHLIGQIGVHHQVGQHTGAVGGHIVGGVVAVGGDLEGGAVGELEDVLGNALAEGPGADDEAVAVIPHGGGKELGGAGGVAVHQDHQRLLDEAGDLHREGVGPPHRQAALPVHHVGHVIVAQDVAHRLDHRRGRAAGVTAQVHHPAVGGLVLGGDVLLKVGPAGLAEAAAAQPADVVVHHLSGDGGEDHRLPGQGELQLPALPEDGDGDVGARLAGDEGGQGVGGAGLLDGGAVGGHDEVAYLELSPFGGGVRGDAADQQAVARLLYHDADTHHVGVAHVTLEGGILLRRHIVGVGIAQGVGDLLDGGQGQDLLRDLVDVVFPEHLPGLIHGDGAGHRAQRQGQRQHQGRRTYRQFSSHGSDLLCGFRSFHCSTPAPGCPPFNGNKTGPVLSRPAGPPGPCAPCAAP